MTVMLMSNDKFQEVLSVLSPEEQDEVFQTIVEQPINEDAVVRAIYPYIITNDKGILREFLGEVGKKGAEMSALHFALIHSTITGYHKNIIDFILYVCRFGAYTYDL